MGFLRLFALCALILLLAKSASAAQSESQVAVFPGVASYDAGIVTELQRALCENGFFVSITGVFDEETCEAVKEFQIYWGLDADGIVDDTLRSYLGILHKDAYYASMWYTANLRNASELLGGNRLIYLNLGEDPHLTIYTRKKKTGWVWAVAKQLAYEEDYPLFYDEIIPPGMSYNWLDFLDEEYSGWLLKHDCTENTPIVVDDRPFYDLSY
ncbi:peptidoglycan-binding protein [Candidatus Saccharibacteria bacterium]|nr:peptidoglycan-binding protein [Candidatus Saccharibacteria bacterium]